MSEADPAEVEARLADAIANVLPGEFVTRWVALVETVDAEDGARGLWTLTSDDVMAWDTVGMLQHGLHLQLAQALRGDDE